MKWYLRHALNALIVTGVAGGVIACSSSSSSSDNENEEELEAPSVERPVFDKAYYAAAIQGELIDLSVNSNDDPATYTFEFIRSEFGEAIETPVTRQFDY